MLELILFGVLVLAGLAVFGTLWAAVSLVCWVLFLPFKLLGLVFRGLAFLFALPLLMLAGVVGMLMLGAGLVVFFIPALPLLLIALGVWWLLRRRSQHTAPASP